MCCLWRLGSGVDLKRAHNPKVVGSNPTPATTENQGLRGVFLEALDAFIRQKSGKPDDGVTIALFPKDRHVTKAELVRDAKA